MPRPAKYEDPKRRILDAARKLSVELGFDRVSLRAIAREAGFGAASLYEYFQDKETIFVALAAEANQALHRALRAAAGAADAGLALVDVGGAYIDFAMQRSEDFLLLFNRHVSKRRSLGEEVPPQSAYTVVIELVVRGIREGTLEPRAKQTPEAAAYAVWALAHGLAMLQLTTLRDFDADFVMADRAALQTLVAGMRR